MNKISHHGDHQRRGEIIAVAPASDHLTENCHLVWSFFFGRHSFNLAIAPPWVTPHMSYNRRRIQYKLSSDELYLSHTQLYRVWNEEWNVFSTFNPSKCKHTWSSAQPTLRHPGSSWGFGALPKGLISVVDTSSQSRDSSPQPWVTSGFKSNAISIRPRPPLRSAWRRHSQSTSQQKQELHRLNHRVHSCFHSK